MPSDDEKSSDDDGRNSLLDSESEAEIDEQFDQKKVDKKEEERKEAKAKERKRQVRVSRCALQKIQQLCKSRGL